MSWSLSNRSSNVQSAWHPPIVIEQGKVAKLLDQVSVKVSSVADSPTAVHPAKPPVGILILRWSYRAEPHGYREAKWFELRNHLRRHVPWVEAGGRHIERGQQAASVV